MDEARKDIFLCYVPHTTRNIIWYDVESQQCKIAVHCVFEKDSMTFLSNHPVPMLSICSALPMEMISLKLKVQLIPGPNQNPISILFWKNKLLLSMSLPLTKILLLVSKWTPMNSIRVFISVMPLKNRQARLFLSQKMVSKII